MNPARSGGVVADFAVYPSNRYLPPKVRAFIDLALERFPKAGDA